TDSAQSRPLAGPSNLESKETSMPEIRTTTSEKQFNLASPIKSVSFSEENRAFTVPSIPRESPQAPQRRISDSSVSTSTRRRNSDSLGAKIASKDRTAIDTSKVAQQAQKYFEK